MSFFTRAAAMLIAASFAVAFPCAPLPAAAQTAKTQTISGTVVDAATGLPLAGATVSVSAGGSPRVVATTDADGRFTLTGLPPGEYVLVAQTQSYQAAQSDIVELLSGTQPAVTLSLQRQTAGSGLAVIGRTSTRRSESLQRSSVIYRSVTSTDVIDQGQFRIADVLKTLPGVFDANAQTASFGDDIRLSVRGIGVLETTALLDGHPLAQGVPGGFSFELSPTAGIRDTSVVYGSGSDLYPVNAIGGIINMQTLDPTRTPQSAVILNYGTFNKTGAIVQRTGSAGRLGYAFAYGSQGLDGPYKHQRLYNFSAAQDPSGGPGSPGYQSGVYDFDSSSNSHTGFAKLRWTFSPATRMTVQWTGVGFYDDKTGNGDGDYQTNALTLANASQGSCPAGQYATFTNSAINGTPAVPCLSRADYLARYGGWNGAGPAFQTLQFNDYAAKFETKLGGGEISLNAFGNRYSQHYDRSKQLPYFYTPGDNPTVRDTYVSNAGAILSDTFNTDRNSFAFGAYLSTLTYTGTSVNAALDPNGNVAVSDIIGAGQAKETSFFVRDSYQFANSPLTAFANIWSKRSTQTGTTSLDPRLALVYNRGGTAVRFAVGATTTQPDLGVIAPFAPVPLGSLVGAHGSVISIGNLKSTGLRPERGVDEELSIGHRTGRDSQVQVTLYNTNVYDKLYSVRTKISDLPPGTIDPNVVSTYAAYLRNNGSTGAVGVSQVQNLAQVRARGIEINGQQAIYGPFAFDYDYATESSALISASDAILTRNLTLIPGSQLQNIPLHRYNVGLRFENRAATVRLGYHHESENNPRNMPAYGYSDLLVAAPVGPGRLSFFVDNLFNQHTHYTGLEFSGYPFALNSHAGPDDYAAQVGTAASETFGLPYRTLNITYSLRR